jgi:vacuolar protein sorting-associated protein 35
MKQHVALLSAPLEKYKDVVVVLKLSNYAQVMEHLDYETNKVMAVVLIQSVLSNSTMITVPETGYSSLSCHNDVFLSLRLCT